MKVKICGITSAHDVETCEAQGADLIGFINIQRSKRYVEVSQIQNLTASMHDKSRAVLVTETEDLDEVESVIEATGIQVVQFHSQSAAELERFKEKNPQVKVIRAVGIPESMKDEKVEEIEGFADICDYLLFDFEVAGKSGGTGKQIPLDLTVKAAKAARKNPQIELFLAGGIDNQRMKSEGLSIRDVFDYVDVNSGVEDQPGEKNRDKIIEFMNTVNKLHKE